MPGRTRLPGRARSVLRPPDVRRGADVAPRRGRDAGSSRRRRKRSPCATHLYIAMKWWQGREAGRPAPRPARSSDASRRRRAGGPAFGSSRPVATATRPNANSGTTATPSSAAAARAACPARSSATSSPPTPERNHHHDHAQPPAHAQRSARRRPHLRRARCAPDAGGSDEGPAGLPVRRAACRDGRLPVQQAVDAHPRVVRGGDRPARRRADDAASRRAPARPRRADRRHRARPVRLRGGDRDPHLRPAGRRRPSRRPPRCR